MLIKRAMNKLQLTTVLACTLILAGGCSGDRPVTYAVTGTITYQGMPLADAQVGFIPLDTEGEPKPARGQTDAQGNYTLTTYLAPGDEAKGAKAGRYQVTVEKGLPQNKVITYEEMKTFKPLSPPRYASAAQTPLTAEVKAGANRFDFTLEETK